MTLDNRHRRPSRLSDPYHDHDESSRQELLATPDEMLDWGHFQALLGPHLPAGTYEEVAYFLPLALDYLLSHRDEALDTVTAVVGFISKNAMALERDGTLEPARGKIRECLATWTSDFVVCHFDREACRKKQWVVDYADLVHMSQEVAECTKDLARFETQSDIALQFVRSLADHQNDFTRAAWFLEYSRRQLDAYAPPEYPPIAEIICDLSRLQCAADVVTSSHRVLEAQTYWRDTFRTLGLAERETL